MSMEGNSSVSVSHAFCCCVYPFLMNLSVQIYDGGEHVSVMDVQQVYTGMHSR